MDMDKKLKTTALVAALIGVIDAAYLTWIKLTNNEALCAGGIGDCYTVNTSRYSEVFGIPIALLGLLAFLALTGIMLLEERIALFRQHGLMMLFGISLIGVLYSAYLTYLEAFVIRAWCPYCVLLSLALTVIFIVSVIRLVRSQPE
jgi:uncharacterized membrane protein